MTGCKPWISDARINVSSTCARDIFVQIFSRYFSAGKKYFFVNGFPLAFRSGTVLKHIYYPEAVEALLHLLLLVLLLLLLVDAFDRTKRGRKEGRMGVKTFLNGPNLGKVHGRVPLIFFDDDNDATFNDESN